MKTYPVASSDWQYVPRMGGKLRDIKAVATGEKRNPKKGEWFLSGAIVEAYYAPNDLSSPYAIAKLVKSH